MNKQRHLNRFEILLALLTTVFLALVYGAQSASASLMPSLSASPPWAGSHAVGLVLIALLVSLPLGGCALLWRMLRKRLGADERPMQLPLGDERDGAEATSSALASKARQVIGIDNGSSRKAVSDEVLAFLRALGQPAALVDPQGIALFANPAFRTLFEMTDESGERVGGKEIDWQEMTSEASAVRECWITPMATTGDRRHVRLFCSACQWQQQRCATVIACDETARHAQAMRDARQSRRYEQVLRCDRDLLGILDEQLLFCDVGAGVSRWFGDRPESLIDHDPIRLLGSHDAHNHMAQFRRALGGERAHFEHVVRRGDAPAIRLRISLLPLWRDGGVCGLLMRGEDRSQAYEELSQLRGWAGRLGRLLERLPFGVASWRAGEQTTEFANAALTRLCGRDGDSQWLRDRALGKEECVETLCADAYEDGQALRIIPLGEDEQGGRAVVVEPMPAAVMSPPRQITAGCEAEALPGRSACIEALGQHIGALAQGQEIACIALRIDAPTPLLAARDETIRQVVERILASDSASMALMDWYAFEANFIIGVRNARPVGHEAEDVVALEALCALMPEMAPAISVDAASHTFVFGQCATAYEALAEMLDTMEPLPLPPRRKADGPAAGEGDGCGADGGRARPNAAVVGTGDAIRLAYAPELDRAACPVAWRLHLENGMPVRLGQTRMGRMSTAATAGAILSQLDLDHFAEGERCPVVSVGTAPRFWRERTLQGLIDFMNKMSFPNHCLRLEVDLGEGNEASDGIIELMKVVTDSGIRLALRTQDSVIPALDDLARVSADEIVLSRSLVERLPDDSFAQTSAQAIAAYGEVLHVALAAEGDIGAERRDFLERIGVSRFYAPPGGIESPPATSSPADSSGHGQEPLAAPESTARPLVRAS